MARNRLGDATVRTSNAPKPATQPRTGSADPAKAGARPSYSVGSATSGLPMNQHVSQYGGPGATPQYRAANPGGGGGGAPGGGMAPMGAVGMPVGDDMLNSDDVYLAALSRYNKQHDDLLADVTRREGDYNTQYDNSLGDLGYIKPGEGGGEGKWAFDNQQTAAGRGYQSLIQDFAARGLLHSGDYLGAQNDFVGSLGKQLGAMNTAKQQFGEGLNQERTTGASSRDAGIGQARAEALARIAQLYGAV